ncbi:MAG: hypothetical protein ACRD1T_15355 [Acidimicrobiia bacterium]
MARKKSTEVNVVESRFILNGKDWNEYTDEEQDAYRAAFTERVMEIAFRPVEEKYGSARFGAVLRAFLQLWNEEREGGGPKVLEERLMNSDAPWPWVLARMIEAVLIQADKERCDAEEAVAERQLPLWPE